MAMRRRLTTIGLLTALALPLAPETAQAYSTRVHIMIANELREALIEADDGTIPLRMSEHAVVLAQEDFEALRDFPLEFRAGAVGPDNMVFPGMTDPSHALGQRPYQQCELLYEAALTGGERAYALGCFLHGATDAIAHHYVNYMSGETFTLNPLTSNRETGLSNVVRHILAESAIQSAAYEHNPSAFDTGSMLHVIPEGFVLRAYLDERSPLWQLVAEHGLAQYEAARAAMPDAALPEVLASMDVAPADHLVLSPVYLGEVEQVIIEQRIALEQAIATMQNPATPDGAQLGVSAGPDGRLGTADDDTACTLSCAQLYATYFTYVGLLAPRFNAMGDELEPAFDKIADELRAELSAFHPAYLATVGNISAKLNEPLTEADAGLGFSRAEVQGLFEPLVTWSDDVATIDYDTLVNAVIPEWIIDLDTAMQAVGIDVNLAGIIEAVFQPFIAPIREAIEEAFIAQAEAFLGDLADEYVAQKKAVEAEYTMRLDAAAPVDLQGNMLDHFYDSGLFAHSFNIAAATMASHDAVLPVGDDPIGIGPASFDASYTAAWMQAGVCPHLSEVIFPLGIDVRGALSVRDGGVDYVAVMNDDSPVECHDGSLGSFAAAPTVVNCMLTDLATLLGAPVGSLSRAYPPELSAMPVECEGTEIPGLPEAPEGEDETGADAGGTVSDDGSGSGGSNGAADGDGGGCGCRGGDPGPAVPLGLLALLGLRRRRRLAQTVVAVTLIGGCGDDGQPGADTMTNDPTAGTTTSAADSTEGPVVSTSGQDTDDVDTSDGDDGLLDALDGTIWHGEHLRDGLTRAYEIQFDSASLLWSEIRNPYGPARLREMRVMVEGAPGEVNTTVISPQGWPIHPDNGRTDAWALELLEGDPRTLRTTRDGVVEEFTEGPWPAPDDGLTAVVRVFEVGGTIDEAFCDSGASGFEYPAIFGFANGQSDEIVATDVVAGAHLLNWSDPGGGNNFSVTDVEGFDRLGGTELSDTFNFFVTYVGTIDHPGGALSMREQNDSVEDAVWVFLEDAVGSSNVGDLFLEVHGFIWPDATDNEPSIDIAAGDVAVQAILVRCTEQISSVDVEISLQGAGFELLGTVGSSPTIDEELFPPAL